MIKRMFRFLTFLSFSIGLAIALPAIPIHAAGGGGGGGGSAPEPSTSTQPSDTKSKPPMKSTHRAKNKQSLFDDPAFAKGYREAYATIYDQRDYTSAIAQLHALGHDDFANVANLIGYF